MEQASESYGLVLIVEYAAEFGATFGSLWL